MYICLSPSATQSFAFSLFLYLLLSGQTLFVFPNNPKPFPTAGLLYCVDSKDCALDSDPSQEQRLITHLPGQIRFRSIIKAIGSNFMPITYP